MLVGLEQVVNRAQALQAEAMVAMGTRARAADEDSGTADTVAEGAIQHGQERTAPQLREWLRGKVIAANPGAAEERR